VKETRQGQYERYQPRLKASAANISVFDTSKSVPVQLALQFDLSNLTEALQYFIIRAIARIVGIPSEQIRILDVRSGSVFLTIEMPSKSAERLIRAYHEQHAVIRDLQITGVETLRIRFDPYSLSLSMLSAMAALKSFTYLQYDEPTGKKKKEHIIRQINHLARLIYESADLLTQFRGFLRVNNVLHHEFWPGAAEILVSEHGFAAVDQMRSRAFRVGRAFPRILNELRPYLAPQESDQLDRVLSKVEFFLKEAFLSPDYRRYFSSMRSSISLIFDFAYDIGSVYEKDTVRLEKIFASPKILDDWNDGEVRLDQIVMTRSKPSETLASSLIWRIPLVSDIAAGLGVIAEENTEKYLVLDDTFRGVADFGVRVVGDSMIGDGILPGDIALIRQQPRVEMGEIAAVVIITPTVSEGVLKKYHLAYAERSDLAHWFLASSNPTSAHIVAIPSGADVAGIRALYDEAIRSGTMRRVISYYADAELAIAGKYIGVLRKDRGLSKPQEAELWESETR
jgi:SOS-response transcriptional repressor LexA